VQNRAQLPELRHAGVFKNAAVGTGVYAGAALSAIFATWVYVANRVPGTEPFALERNLTAAGVLSLLALVPLIRFCRLPGQLLASGLIAWSIVALTYRIICVYFPGLAEQASAFQIFIMGAVVYMILATLCWVGRCLWRAKGSGISHSNHHVS
jgi:hypothetical protein